MDEWSSVNWPTDDGFGLDRPLLSSLLPPIHLLPQSQPTLKNQQIIFHPLLPTNGTALSDNWIGQRGEGRE